MMTEREYKETIDDYFNYGHDILFIYKGKLYFLSHCGENGDYLQDGLDGKRLFECDLNKGLTDIFIDGKPIIEVLKESDIDSVY